VSEIIHQVLDIAMSVIGISYMVASEFWRGESDRFYQRMTLGLLFCLFGKIS
jgi:hypothetical protein